MNKVTLIARQIGAKPVLAFGNSMTDASMLNYTIHGNRYRAMGFMVCCDDLEREYGNAAKADRMRDACRKNGWTRTVSARRSKTAKKPLCSMMRRTRSS